MRVSGYHEASGKTRYATKVTLFFFGRCRILFRVLFCSLLGGFCEQGEFHFFVHCAAGQPSSRTWPRVTEGFTNDWTMHCGAAGASALWTTNATEVVAKMVTVMSHCAFFCSCSRGRSLSACIISASSIPRWLKHSARVLSKNLDDTCTHPITAVFRLPPIVIAPFTSVCSFSNFECWILWGNPTWLYFCGKYVRAQLSRSC